MDCRECVKNNVTQRERERERERDVLLQDIYHTLLLRLLLQHHHRHHDHHRRIHSRLTATILTIKL
jgi:hypothetical protein